MTTTELRNTGLAMIAHSEGKPVQCLVGGKWMDIPNPTFRDNPPIYRPKPEPRVRPWSKPEDVPGPVCWVRKPTRDDMLLVFDITSRGINTIGPNIEWDKINEWEHSTDRKTWHKCECVEDAQ